MNLFILRIYRIVFNYLFTCFKISFRKKIEAITVKLLV